MRANQFKEWHSATARPVIFVQFTSETVEDLVKAAMVHVNLRSTSWLLWIGVVRRSDSLRSMKELLLDDYNVILSLGSPPQPVATLFSGGEDATVKFFDSMMKKITSGAPFSIQGPNGDPIVAFAPKKKPLVFVDVESTMCTEKYLWSRN